MYKQIAIHFFFLAVIAFTFFIIFRMYNANEKKLSKKMAFLHIIFIWYLCAVAAVTVVPIRASRTEFLPVHTNFTPVINSYHRYFSVMRSKDVEGIRNYFINLFGNLMLFVPFGAMLPLLYKKSFRQVVFIAAVTSVLIETLQWLNMFMGYYRYVDIDDVILNTLSAVIGYCLYKILLPYVRKQSWL